jgi:cyanophycin synthetase
MVHPENITMAERISKIIGLDVCGIDVMAENLTQPLKESGGAIIEVNAAPGFRMHLAPSEGLPRNVAHRLLICLSTGKTFYHSDYCRNRNQRKNNDHKAYFTYCKK